MLHTPSIFLPMKCIHKYVVAPSMQLFVAHNMEHLSWMFRCCAMAGPADISAKETPLLLDVDLRVAACGRYVYGTRGGVAMAVESLRIAKAYFRHGNEVVLKVHAQKYIVFLWLFPYGYNFIG